MKRSIQNHLMMLSLLLFALLLSGAGWAQRSINGTVTDPGGQPLPGVSVVVKGTVIGVATNMDGKYTLELPDNATTLVFSFIGMISVEEQVAGRTTIDVVLRPETIGLDEVVAVGYGVQKKATLTGSVGNIKSEELLRRPAANTTDLLTGTISGLITRQASGIPGGDGTTLNIRGFSSSPLIIVDGIEGTLGQIDPNDIESISVLKDASAAVYGARAGNGVILVTTKRGSEMDNRITYHGTVSYTQPTFLLDRVSADKWAEMLNETGLDVNLYTPSHVKYDKTNNTLTNTADGSIYKGYDWPETLMRDWTPQQQHNLSAIGGSKNVKYFISAGFTDQESNFTSGDYDFNRYNIRSNIDAKINNNLNVSVDFSYRTQVLDKANFTLEDMYNSLETAKPVFPVFHENDPARATYSGFLQRSPYAQTFKDFSGSIVNRTNVVQGAIELKYAIPMIKGLTAKARLTYEEIFGWDKTISKPFDVWEYNQSAAGTDNEWVKRGTQNTNRISVTSDRSTDLLPLVSLEYEKQLGGHSLKGIIIGETRTFKSTSLSGSRKDLLSYETPYLRYASQLGIDNNENANEVARTGIIGRVNYDYQGKYILEVAMRADASAEYPEKGRWGYFPSISGGWRISEESFIKDKFKAVDNLKLRASYGVLGYDAVSSFAYLTGYLVSAESYLFGSTPAPIISSAGLPNPYITWETMTLYNVGLDGSFYKGLLGFEADVFYRLRDDILATPDEQVPSTFGASLPQTNLNKRDNRGFEISLFHRNKIGKFAYEISPMVSWSRGKYVSLQEEVSATDPEWNARYVNEGQWDDRFWAYVSDGIFQSEEEIANHKVDQSYNGDDIKNNNVFVGDIIYKDLNNDSIIDWHDQKVIGTTGLPKTMYSLNLNGQYKGFSVDLLFQGGANYRVAFSGSAASPFSNESIPLVEHYEHRAIVGLDDAGKKYITNPDAKLPPVFQTGQTPNNKLTSDYWSYDARFLRLKSVNVSYTLPEAITSKYNFHQCTFYVSSSNLWTISNLGIWKDSFDPEVVTQNGRSYPPVKTVSLGLKLTL